MKENAFDLTVTALREQGLNSDEILKELSCIFQRLTNSDMKSGTKNATETRIRELLKNIGMPNHLKGYEYWVVAIQIYKKNVRTQITKEIYPQVAKIYKTTPSKVERSMRHAVEVAFERCPEDIIMEVFGNYISSKRGIATNTEFLATMAEQV